MSFVLVFLGGGIGASLRFWSSLLFGRFSLGPYWSTLLVNALGSLLFVLLAKWGRDTGVNHYFLRVGLLGAMTTFSTFSFEAAGAFERSQFALCLAIIGCNLLLGLVPAFIILKMS